MAARRKVGTVRKRKTRRSKPEKTPAAPAVAPTNEVSKPEPPSEPTPADPVKTARRRRFVEEFLISGNGTQAALLAGFSANRAAETACELLKDPIIAAEIARRQADMHARLHITQERVLTERAAIAFSDLGEIMGEKDDGSPFIRPLKDWPPLARKAIKSIKVKRVVPKDDKSGEQPYEILEFGLWNKPESVDRIESRMDSEKVANTGTDLANLTDAERLRIIADVLSRGRQAMQAAKAPKQKKAS